MSIFMFPIFQYIEMCIKNWNQAVLYEERYWYFNIDYINDTLRAVPFKNVCLGGGGTEDF